MSITSTVIPEGNTVIEYPRSGRRVVKNSKGEVISDSKNDKNKKE
jgi:hypothetical protein